MFFLKRDFLSSMAERMSGELAIRLHFYVCVSFNTRHRVFCLWDSAVILGLREERGHSSKSSQLIGNGVISLPDWTRAR